MSPFSQKRSQWWRMTLCSTVVNSPLSVRDSKRYSASSTLSWNIQVALGTFKVSTTLSQVYTFTAAKFWLSNWQSDCWTTITSKKSTCPIYPACTCTVRSSISWSGRNCPTYLRTLQKNESWSYRFWSIGLQRSLRRWFRWAKCNAFSSFSGKTAGS